tara:strand:+ start:328 stop:813 length:486 start_codon:yes stop_codon:yes gene_type:complete
MTVLNRDSIQVRRDIERRIEDYVIKYCEALEENFKQYSIESYKRNIENPNNKVIEGYKSYYQEQLEKIENGTANLYKFDYKIGKKYIKVFNLQYDTFQNRNEYKAGSVTAFIDRKTGEVYKPASWKAPAKHVRFDLRLIKDREFLHNWKNVSWTGGHLYMR